MKVCNKCKEEKSLNEYHKDSNKKDNLCTICKVCKIENSKRWAKANPDKAKSLGKESYKRLKADPQRYAKRAVYIEEWRKLNPDKHAAKESRRRAAKLKATPSWLSGEQLAHMKRMFKWAKVISDETSVPYEVDHIVPLQGKNVCGLHVPWNLQVIPASVNRSKGNRL